MNNPDDQKIFMDIIKRAESEEHTQFEYIRNWQEYAARKTNQRALRLLVKSLNTSINKLLKKYCKAVRLGNADVTTLLVVNKLTQTKSYYDTELAAIDDMVCEYDAYLMDGKLLFAAFGEIRSDSDCWDRRGMDL